MKRIINIGEETERSLVADILTEWVNPSSDQTMLVWNFLNKHFSKGYSFDVDASGLPKRTPIANYMDNDGKTVLMQFTPRKLLLLLKDKFPHIMQDEKDLDEFLTKAMNFWFAGKDNTWGVMAM